MAKHLFSIDIHALAALRIGIALIVIVDLAVRISNISAHYSEVGILPRAARIVIFDMEQEKGIQHWWSLHLVNGELWFQWILFFAAALFAMQLLVGYRTRMATVLTWVLLASVQARLPMVLQGGDSLLRMILFWGMFLPLGETCSVDSRNSDLSPANLNQPRQRVTSIATAALMLQIAMVYLCNAAAKNSPVWHTDYTAIYYVLSLDLYATHFASYLLQFPTLLKVLTGGTWWLEWIAPFALFWPWRLKSIRSILVILFLGFHAGLAMCLHLGLLSYVAMVAWLIFLPTEFWNKLHNVARAASTRWPVRHYLIPGRSFRLNTRPSMTLGWLGKTFVGFALVYVIFWNGLLIYHNQVAAWPTWFNVPGQILRLEQHWVMFAPKPMTDDGWFVMRGTLMDGSEVNLWQPDEPLPYKKPSHVADLFPNHRWRKYFVNFVGHPDARLLYYLSNWLAHNWNDQRARGDSAKTVRTVQILLITDLTPAPGELPPPHQTLELWNWNHEHGEPISAEDLRPPEPILTEPVDAW